MPVAGRVVFQMDQAASSHQRFLRYIREHRKTKIWTVVSVYVLVAIVKKRLNLSASLYEMLQILSLTLSLFERIPLDQLFHNIITTDIQALSANQLNLFDYSEVGNLENTTSLLSLFYAGFVSVVVVIITDC